MGEDTIDPTLFEKAEDGDVDAQFELGVRHAFGQGAPQDIKKAAFWFKKAAEQGYVLAQYNLALCYADGRGIPQDIKKAAEWYRKAAEQGNVDSMNNLAVLYAKGEGVANDLKKAVHWFEKAAAQGDAIAQYNLAIQYENGQGVPQDSAKAAVWYEKAAKQGHLEAQYKAAFLCYIGRDYKKAVFWYEKAAEGGHLEAQYKLGTFYNIGRGVPQDYKKSAFWYKRAADEGHLDAMNNLGNLYAHGLGVAIDHEIAAFWYEKAAANGNKTAQKNLELLNESRKEAIKEGVKEESEPPSMIELPRLERMFEEWKKSLFDTTKRNKMINYRETKHSTLRILEPEFSELFERLTGRDKALTFQRPIDRDTDFRTYAVLKLLERLSYPLSVNIGDIKGEGSYSENQEKLKHLRGKAKTINDEQGVNALYLSFGFIEWREDASSPLLISPLLMVPVAVKQPAIHSQYILSLHDDDIEVNPTLDYYFNEKHNVDLPTFEKTTIDEYMNLIEGIVDKHGWRLIREVSLGLFSFMKINMHHDLQKNKKIIFKNPIIRAFAGDRQSIETPPREDRFDEEAPKDCYQVHLADSSQQEAIQLSKKGGSFIIQGPPGTGKSQTITNIIAEALAAGKKVLFVSEKLAALEVVYKRLKEAGLDDFCLPLHSHKANKREILNEIGKNLNLKEKPIRLKDSAMTELTELFRDRGQLNKYAEELHAATPLGESLYEVFGKLAKVSGAPSIDFIIPNPAAISADSFNNLSYSVKNYEKALKNMGCRLSENPWRGAEIIQTGADFWQTLSNNTSGLKEKLLVLSSTFAEQQKKFLFHSPLIWNRVEQTIRLFAAIKDLPLFPFELKDDTYRAELIKKAEKNAQDKAAYLKKLSETRTFFKDDIFAHDLSGWLKSVDESVEKIRYMGAEKSYQNIFKRAELIHNSTLALEAELQRLEKALKEAAAILRVDMDKPIFNKLSDISEIIGTFINGKPVQREWFNELSLEKAERFLRSAKEHSESISKLKAGVLEKYEKEAFEIDAKAMLFRFKTEYSGFFGRLFNIFNYRKDKKLLRGISKNFLKEIEDTEILAVLTALKDIKAEREWFTNNKETLQTHFGEYYYGEETDWSALENALKRAANFLELFPNRIAPQAVIDMFIKRSEHELLKTARILSPENVRGAITRINNTFSGQYSTFEEIFPKLTDVISASGRIAACIKAVTPAHIGELNPAELPDKVKTAAAAQAKKEELLKVQPFFPGGAVLETDMRGVIQNLSLIDAFFRDKEFAFAGDAFFKQMCDNGGTREEIEIALEDLRDKYETAKKPLFKWTSHFEDETPFYGMEIPELITRFSACLASPLSLDGWIGFKEAKAECVKAGLTDFADKTAELPPAFNSIYDIFCKWFYVKWISSVIGGKEAVLQFRRSAQDAKVERFIELDKKQLLIARARIREKIISGFPEMGGFTFAKDEMGILKRELGKKRAHKPLRKLFNEIPNLLSALKPCLMMSPLSVAYFLENYRFDTVIFDEASQIFPQDAIGAIFRGTQLIIAGDSKQLPPTDFFLGKKGGADYDGLDDEEGEDDYDGDIGESILEKAGEILSDSRLSWHYRSKHENLIAFSNQEIYNAELITFPSRIAKSEDNGVDFIYVEDGEYESGGRNRNVREAEMCVELVKEHIDRYKTRSARSLGIIAFSEKQGQQISLAVQRFREQNPQYEDFFLEGGEDEFFVKNLENVQGDERDTIIFSVGYAKTKEQKESGKPMPMRFGPLSAKGGERRLNVAITRAKRNVKLVSSILPSDLNLSHTNSEGVKMLRSYIEFAMSGKLSERKKSGFDRDEDNFVSAVNDFINSCGYRTKKHLGHSDYKLDIAVEHPSKEGVYIAGIECDGYAYKKAKTARDRDHLRKSVLESMNWNMYRIWSAEWRTNAEIEREKLRNFIAEAVQNFNFEGKSAENPPIKEEVSYIAEGESLPSEGNGFDYYVEANWDDIPGRKEADIVRHIVNIEQPIHRNLLYQRMLSYYGLNRVSAAVSNPVLRIIKKKPFLIDTGGFVTLEGFADITPRVPQDGGVPRSIEHISPKELSLLMLVIAAKSFGITEEGLFDAARDMLGYARKSEKISQRMREALSGLVAEGKITINNGKLSVKT